ncbi:MAG: carboxypeptidase-like regulatory domain-containing protein [Gemmatimonadota bacterium]|nr:carboxypeptidase-like regulatory domain-containing protein [Gemmatimonadota bacterium]
MVDPHIGHLDEGTIHAWIDGALPPNEAARVESHAVECAPCAALVAEARGLVAASKRILSALDDVPAGVIPNASPTTIESIKAAAAREDVEERHLAVASMAMGGASDELPRTREYRQAAGARSFASRYGPIAAVLACVAVGLSALQWFKPAASSVAMDRISATASSPAPAETVRGPSVTDERAALPRPGVALPTPPAPSAAARLNAPANTIASMPDAGAASTEQKAKKADEEAGLRRAIGQTQATGRATSGSASGAGGAVDGRASAPIIAALDSVNRRLESAKQLAVADKSADRRDVTANTAAPRALAQERDRQPAEVAPAAPPARQRALAPVIISGKVTDSVSGQPLAATLVYIRGTDIKTETNANGEYVLRVPLGPQQLSANRLGYAPRTTLIDAVTDRAIVASFPLRPTPASLDAVVATTDLAEKDGFAAAPPAIDGLTLKGSSTTTDAASIMRRSVYEVRPGVEVTLVESRPIAQAKEKLEAPRETRAQQLQRAAPSAAPTGAVAAKPRDAAIHTVRWTLPDGRTIELSGPMSADELEALRKRVR